MVAEIYARTKRHRGRLARPEGIQPGSSGIHWRRRTRWRHSQGSRRSEPRACGRSVGQAANLCLATQGPDITPGDIVGRHVEVLRAQDGEARHDGVDLGLAGDESGKGIAVVWGFTHPGRSVLVAPYML